MKYFRYLIKNIEPLRIADDSTSQSGQTISLRYIPGSAIRGYIVNKLAKSADFETYKKVLFSNKVRFQNAYLYENGRELIPSPKGFYEDKTATDGEKKIQNVVIDGEFTEGYKRAGLGRFCYIEDGCINYYSVATGSDMKIQINQGEKQNVFRNEYISAGNKFVGYIAIDSEDEILESIIGDTFKKQILVGNARSQGLGKCEILAKDYVTEIPYNAYAVDRDVKECCYMMLLSNTTMRNELGEYTGVEINELCEKLGCDSISIKYCATSTVNVKGYNRNWGGKTPTVNMYEMGSVFKLEFPGKEISAEKMREVMKQGIGVRRNEGFGQIIFLKDYEAVDRKKEGLKETSAKASFKAFSGDAEALKIAAVNRYRSIIETAMEEKILKNEIRLNINSSQVGNVRALLEANRYKAEQGVTIIKAYFEHAQHKEEKQNVQKQKKKIVPFAETIIRILEKPLAETLGIEKVSTIMTYSVDQLIKVDELYRMKYDFILKIMKFSNRKGDK